MKTLVNYWAATCLSLVLQGGRSLPFPKILNKTRAGQPENWYSILAAGEGAERLIEVFVFGEIGAWGITAQQFVADLKVIDDGVSKVLVKFATIGGDLMDGIAIHNALKDLGERCEGRIVGACYSAGTVAISGAHRVTMADNGLYMIHNPSLGWLTDVQSDELRAYADLLDKTRELIVTCYKRRAVTVSDDELLAKMKETTFMTAEEAKAIGLIDEVLVGEPIKAAFGNAKILNRYGAVPQAALDLLASAAPEPTPDPLPDPKPEPEPDPVTLAAKLTEQCQAAGIANLATVLITASGLKSEAAVLAAVNNAKAVRDLCVVAKSPEQAEAMIKAGLTQDQVRAKLFEAMVTNSEVSSINNLPPVDRIEPESTVKAVNPREVYAQRKAKALKGGTSV